MAVETEPPEPDGLAHELLYSARLYRWSELENNPDLPPPSPGVYGWFFYTYDRIFGRYLVGARAVTVEDPYIRSSHQIANFLHFCETVVRAGPTVRRINLITRYDEKTDLMMVRNKLEELKESLRERDVLLDFQWSENIHDREVRIDNEWIVKIGRGLDFYQRPDGWSSIGASDLGLRKCLETKVDIFRHS